MFELNDSNRAWQIGILLVMTIAALIYITGYDYGLPYLERLDERRNLNETYSLRGLHDRPLTKPGYPPGILWVYEGAQIAVEATTGESAIAHPSQVVRYVRMAAVVVILTGIYATALSARELGGNLAGWLAAVVWTSSPTVTAPIMVGYPQAWEFMFYSLTLYFALRALKEVRPIWAMVSLGCGLGAVIFKYAAFPILGFGVGVTLWHLHIQPKRWLKILGIQVALIIITAIPLISSTTILVDSGHHEAVAFVRGGLNNIFNLQLGTTLLARSLELIDLPLILFVALLVAGTLAYWRQVSVGQQLAWVTLIGITLFNIWSVTAYLVHPGGYHRYTAPSSSYLAILAAVAAVALAQRLIDRWQRRWLTGGIVALLLLLWIVPSLLARIHIAQIFTWPTTPLAMADWVANTLPDNDETIFLYCDRKNFRLIEGGYQGPPHPVYSGFELTDQPVANWRDEGIYYVHINRSKLEEIRAAPGGEAYLADMTLLKQIPSPEDDRQWRRSEWRNEPDCRVEDLFVFWTGTIQNTTDLIFGETIRLLGFDLSAAEVHPGDTITLRLFWLATEPPSANYLVYNHLVPLDTRQTLLAQADGQPARNINRPTITWADPYEIIISPDYVIPVPPDLAPGEYRLTTGLYDSETGQRLLTQNGDDFYPIVIRVVAEED